MAMITRTVMSSAEHSTYVKVDGKSVVPQRITMFGPGTRVEVRATTSDRYAVRVSQSDPLNVFGDELWCAAP